jgi:putative DNA methylase
MEAETMSGRFLIETLLPIRELSEEARREKAIRHGHISTLHVWWARRPLVVARAAVLGALLPEEAEVDERFLANLCRWEVHDGDPGGRYLLERARTLVRRRFGDRTPKVLDSFAGGGSIPLEALRLGAEAYAVEYNPVAYLILKATVEYPQRFGQKLAREVKRFGDWVLERAKRELAEFYPPLAGETPIAYIWSRTIRCPNPSCGAEIPLFRQFWLARKGNKKVALKPVPNRTAKRVDFVIVQGGAVDFDPAKGTVSRGNAVCLVCGTSVKDDYVKVEAQAGRMGHRLVAVVTTRGKGQGRNYRLATEEDRAAFRKAEEALQNLLQTPSPWPFGLPWVPEEPMDQRNPNIVSGRGYGFREWGQLFNPRQLLALVTFGKWVRAAHGEIFRQTSDPDFARAVATYLALAVDKLTAFNNCLTRWFNHREGVCPVFSGHHLNMVWDYVESYPLWEGTGSWLSGISDGSAVTSRESRIPQVGSVHLGSAAALPFPDRHFDAVVVDPPYADNVPYADLSDFFYVWLRRTVGDLYPEAFATPLVPKDEEAVVNPARFGGGKRGEQIAQAHYQRLMQEAFAEIYRVLKPEGMAVVMFTHRSTKAWESLIQALLDAGLYPTASFPVHTEFEGSTHQTGKGAIQSTILMACRRRPENAGVGWYARVREELEQVIRERLSEFWEAQIRGADFFVSAIGPAVGVFGRYRKVMRPDGQEITVENLLDEVRTIVTVFTLEKLGLSRLDEPTRFYVLYRWAYGGETLSFDEVNKLAKSSGVELDVLSEKHRLVLRRKDQVELLTFRRRMEEQAFRKSLQKALEDGSFLRLPEIDQLHLFLYLWRKGEVEALSGLLGQAGILSEDHPLWQVAQALLEIEQNRNGQEAEEEATALAQLLGSRRSLIRQSEASWRAAAQLRLFE